MSTYLPIQAGCEFSTYGGGRYVLHTPDKRHFLVSSTTKELLEALGQGKPLESICENLSGQNGNNAEELRRIILTRYGHLPIFGDSERQLSQPAQHSLVSGLAFLKCWDLVPAKVVDIAAGYLLWLFKLGPFLFALAFIVAAHIVLYSRGIASFTFRLPYGSPISILLLSLLSILAHEMGHASALSRYGAAPGKIGFGLYLLMPAFYADVSQVWRLPRRARFAVDLGGVYFQQLAFAVFTAFATYYSSSEFAAACYAIDAMTLFALNPVFRFDGYWLLADWFELPKLHRDAMRLLKDWALRLSVLLHIRTTPVNRIQLRLSRLQTAVFVIYAVCCNLFLAFTLFWSLRHLRSTLFGFFERLPSMLSRITLAAAVHKWTAMTDTIVLVLVSFAFAATAIWGLYLYCRQFIRMIRRFFPNPGASRSRIFFPPGDNL